METILGIDPGSRITGFGIIQSDGIRHRYVSSGCIRMQSTDLAIRLQQIFDGLREVIATHQPDHAAIEQVFMHQNVASALKLGHARGAAMVVAAIHTIPIAEYTARQVKQAVVGYGAAKKNQVQHMIKTLLNLSAYPQADAADALAVAICHANSRFSLGNMRQAVTKQARGRTISNRKHFQNLTENVTEADEKNLFLAKIRKGRMR